MPSKNTPDTPPTGEGGGFDPNAVSDADGTANVPENASQSGSAPANAQAQAQAAAPAPALDASMLANAIMQAAKSAGQATNVYAAPTVGLDYAPKGGRYIERGRWVDANGVPIEGVSKAEADEAQQAQARANQIGGSWSPTAPSNLPQVGEMKEVEDEDVNA